MRGGRGGKVQHVGLGRSSKAWSACAVILGLLPEGPGIAERFRSSFCSSLSWDDNAK